MRAPLATWTRQAPPNGRVVTRRGEHHGRIDEMAALSQKHTAKATLLNPEAQRIATLHRMLNDLRHELRASGADQPERVEHLADAIRDLETMIARAVFRPLEPARRSDAVDTPAIRR